MKTILYIAILGLTFTIAYGLGKQSKQKEIEERTKEMPTNNINESQLEYIIFGEVQL